MADDTPEQPPVAGINPSDLDRLLSELLSTPAPPAAQPVQNTADNAPSSWTARLGERLAGGPPSDYQMTKEQREAEGNRALLNAGLSMMSVGPWASIGQGLALGPLGAQQSQAMSELTAAGRQQAAQDWQAQSIENRAKAVDAASKLTQLKLSLAQLGLMQNMPNPLMGGGATKIPTVTAAPSGAPAPTGNLGDIANKQDFIDKFTPVAQQISAKTGLPVNYVIGQAGLETGWGSSTAAKNNNFFGISDSSGKPLSYKTPQEGIDAYTALMSSKRYKDVPRTGSPQEIGDAMAIAGYNPNVPKPGSTDSYGARIGSFAGSIPATGKSYQVASTTPIAPPAQGGGGAATTMPVPPIPPQGAVPTIATAEDAGATAKATGQAQPVPGTQALWAKPEGGVTGTPPRTIWPGVQTAGPAPAPAAAHAPAAAPAPAPVTTTPPAVPAPQPTTQQPTDNRPDDQLTWQQFRARHLPQPTDADRATFTLPQDQAAIAEATAAKNAAAQQLSIARMRMDDKASNQAEANFESASNNLARLQADVNKGNAERQQAWQTKQDELLSAQYLQAKQAANAIKLEQTKGQTESETKVMDGLNELHESARTGIDQINTARALSRAAGDPTIWQQIQSSHPDMVRWLANTGALSEEQVSQLGMAGALDAAMNKLIASARVGTGFQRMTNLDVQILRAQAPQGTDPQQWREAKLAYLQGSLERQMRYVDTVRSLRADGVPLYEAQNQAQSKAGDAVPQMPTFTDQPGMSAKDQRLQWVQQNVPDHTFYRAPDGRSLLMWPPPAVSAVTQSRSLVPTQ